MLARRASRSPALVLAERRDLSHHLRGLDHALPRRGRRSVRRTLRGARELGRSGGARAGVERTRPCQHGAALSAQEMAGAVGGRLRPLRCGLDCAELARARRCRARGATRAARARSPLCPGRDAGVPGARRVPRRPGVLGRRQRLWTVRLWRSQRARASARCARRARRGRDDSSERVMSDPACLLAAQGPELSRGRSGPSDRSHVIQTSRCPMGARRRRRYGGELAVAHALDNRGLGEALAIGAKARNKTAHM